MSVEMPEQSLVSVIVAAYNCQATISETLDKLFDQDYQPIEIIVVNDGSTDNTLSLLQSYGDKIRLVDQPNAGAPSARNHGIQVANGEFISFCDADDLWSANKVSEQVGYLLANPDVGMVYCDWYVWNPGPDGRFVIPATFNQPGVAQQIDPENSGWIYHKLLLDCICLTSTVMLRKSIADTIGFFDTSLYSGEDYDYWLKISRITQIHKLKAQMVLYRILPQSISRTPTPVHFEYKVLQQAIARWGVLSPDGGHSPAYDIKKRMAGMQFGFGYLHYNSGDLMIAIGSFWNAIKQTPFWYLPWAYLLLSLWKRLAKSV